MGLVAHPTLGKQKAVDITGAFIAGAPRDAVGHVFYGVNETNADAWRKVIRSGEDYYFIDNSFFDSTRQTYFRVAKNALQHSGRGESDGKRFAELGIQIKRWRESGGHIVLCPQSDQFMSVTVGHVGNWSQQIAATLVELTRRPLLVRAWSRDKGKSAATLEGDLEGAHALITWSSAAAVTAVLNGIPVVTLGQCAAEPMAGSLADIERLPTPGRDSWAAVLADHQFTLVEMASGYAWSKLNDQ